MCYTQEINNLPFAYITKEIIQQKDINKYTPNTIQTHLSKALRQPNSKIYNYNNKYLSGRYWDDYILKFKFMQSLFIVGFSLNPENAPGECVILYIYVHISVL